VGSVQIHGFQSNIPAEIQITVAKVKLRYKQMKFRYVVQWASGLDKAYLFEVTKGPLFIHFTKFSFIMGGGGERG
jgi:hypothetical protein